MGHLIFILAVVLALSLEAFVVIFRRGVGARLDEKRSRLVMLLSSNIGIFAGFLWPAARDAFFAPFDAFRYLGVAVLLIGSILRALVVLRMGRHFSIDPGVQPGQVLITDGIFRFIRHPAYAGSFLAYLGVAFSMGHPLTTTLMATIPNLGILYRIWVEERILDAVFGQEFRHYCLRSKRIIPFLF